MRARCTKCDNEFEFDPKPQQIPANEVVKFAEKAPRCWTVLVMCPKCGHRKAVEIEEKL